MNKKILKTEILGEMKIASRRQEPFSPVLIVAPDDCSMAKTLGLPIGLVTFVDLDVEFKLQDVDYSNNYIPNHEVFCSAVGCLAVSAQGKAEMLEFSEKWRSKFGHALPESFVSETYDAPTREELVDWLIGCLASSNKELAKRNTGYLRELGILRRNHDETQTSFRKLEQFAFAHGLNRRELNASHAPVSHATPIVLEPGRKLVQRLPGSSIGLSDVAIYPVVDTQIEQGLLTCSLFSPDTSATVATWTIPAAKIKNGWLRLAFEQTLDNDPISLDLQLSWQGTNNLILASSISHPEPRFQTKIDGEVCSRLIAFKKWSGIAGARLVPTLGAHVHDSASGDVRVISRERLRIAAEAAEGTSNLDFDPVNDALVVHVVPEGVAFGRLEAAVLAGAKKISAILKTQSEKGPNIEYSIAVSPASQRAQFNRSLPKFEDSLCSEWFVVDPNESSEAVLILKEPLQEDSDIYLLTRLPKGDSNADFGWSSFSRIKIWT